MARPREFDEAAAIDAAIQQFWANGYEATSVRDLAGCMGITGSSLYNAFGDKRSLYQQALDRYIDQSFGDRVKRFDAYPPREAIQAFFSEIIERSLADPQRKGCMLVNSAMEVAPHDHEFQQVIAGVLVEVEAFFRRCVESGQRNATITRDLPAADIARLLLGILVGIRVLVRARPERELLEGLVRPAMAMLDCQQDQPWPGK